MGMNKDQYAEAYILWSCHYRVNCMTVECGTVGQPDKETRIVSTAYAGINRITTQGLFSM
jgi:hypothetical protein